jgi:hypothetical protein
MKQWFALFGIFTLMLAVAALIAKQIAPLEPIKTSEEDYQTIQLGMECSTREKTGVYSVIRGTAVRDLTESAVEGTWYGDDVQAVDYFAYPSPKPPVTRDSHPTVFLVLAFNKQGKVVGKALSMWNAAPHCSEPSTFNPEPCNWPEPYRSHLTTTPKR